MVGPVGEDQAVAVLAECGEDVRCDLPGALLNGRGVSFAILTPAAGTRWPPIPSSWATRPWYSVRDADEPIGGEMGHVSCFLSDGDRVFLTYSTTGRGTGAASGSLALPDMTPYGRGAAWQTSPDGWPEGHDPCWYWRSDAVGNAAWGLASRPGAAVDPPRRDPSRDPGRHGHHH